MASSIHDGFEQDLPSSVLPFPSSPAHWFKYAFWRVYTPFHPFVRDFGLTIGVVSHTGRQPFRLGTIAPDHSVGDVVNRLLARGWGNHFIAWKDDGEVVSLRKLDGFTHQYHLRIFSDGEIRGHYEYTPECYPILHFKAIHQEDRRAELLAELGDFVS